MNKLAFFVTATAATAAAAFWFRRKKTPAVSPLCPEPRGVTLLVPSPVEMPLDLVRPSVELQDDGHKDMGEAVGRGGGEVDVSEGHDLQHDLHEEDDCTTVEEGLVNEVEDGEIVSEQLLLIAAEDDLDLVLPAEELQEGRDLINQQDKGEAVGRGGGEVDVSEDHDHQHDLYEDEDCTTVEKGLVNEVEDGEIVSEQLLLIAAEDDLDLVLPAEELQEDGDLVNHQDKGEAVVREGEEVDVSEDHDLQHDLYEDDDCTTVEVDVDTDDSASDGDVNRHLQDGEAFKISVQNSLDYADDGGLAKGGDRWVTEEKEELTGVKELHKSKWSKELDEDSDNPDDAERNPNALTGLMQARGKNGKSVHWGDRVNRSGFSIEAAKKRCISSLVIGPAFGYNLKSNPMKEEQIVVDTIGRGNDNESMRRFHEQLCAEDKVFATDYQAEGEEGENVDCSQDSNTEEKCAQDVCVDVHEKTTSAQVSYVPDWKKKNPFLLEQIKTLNMKARHIKAARNHAKCLMDHSDQVKGQGSRMPEKICATGTKAGQASSISDKAVTEPRVAALTNVVPSTETSATGSASVSNKDDFPDVPGYPIYVKNLPPTATAEKVEVEFSRFGSITPGGVQVKRQQVGRNCFGFVEFESNQSMRNAILASPVMFEGRRAFVEEKRTPIRVKNSVIVSGLNARDRSQNYQSRNFTNYQPQNFQNEVGESHNFQNGVANSAFGRSGYRGGSGYRNPGNKSTHDRVQSCRPSNFQTGHESAATQIPEWV